MVSVASAKGGVASAVAAVLQDVEMGVPWSRTPSYEIGLVSQSARCAPSIDEAEGAFHLHEASTSTYTMLYEHVSKSS